jgi:hypothetical protein
LQTGEITTTDIAALTQNANTEFAVIRNAAGERQLIQLGTAGGDINDISRLIIHSHPGGIDAIRLGVSGADVSALGKLGQEWSLIVNSEGTVAAFGPAGDPVILKQWVFGGWQFPLRP